MSDRGIAPSTGDVTMAHTGRYILPLPADTYRCTPAKFPSTRETGVTP